MADDDRAAFIKAVTDVEKDYLAGKYESGSVVSAVVDDVILPLAAELAAANTRLGDVALERDALKDDYRKACEEIERLQHHDWEDENAALSARLERVRALADEWEQDGGRNAMLGEELRAALGEDA